MVTVRAIKQVISLAAAVCGAHYGGVIMPAHAKPRVPENNAFV
jgi:hypothetical protein